MDRPQVKADQLLEGTGRARGASQSIGLLKHVVILGLLPRKKADQDEGGTKQQAHQHDLAVRAFVSVVK